MILDPLVTYADAIVMAWSPGSEAGGITDILFGDRQYAEGLQQSYDCAQVKPQSGLPVLTIFGIRAEI